MIVDGLIVAEAELEKRLFSLSGRSERFGIIGNGIFYVIVSCMGVRVSWSDHVYRYLWLALLVFLSVGQWWRYKANVSGRLEVTDEGLVKTSWPRSAERIAWDDVAKVKVWPDSGGRSASAIVSDARRRSISIPGTCNDSAEILRMLRQRLPQQVFEER